MAAQRSAAEDLPEHNRFSAEADAPGPVSPLYATTGELQQVTKLPALVAYHLPRVLAVLVFPAVLVWFFGLCFPGRPDLVGASTLLALFVTGVTAVAPWLPGADRSPEWVSESNVLRSFTVFPHFAVAYAGLTVAYGAIALALARRSLSLVAAVASVAGLLIAVSHTFLVLAVAIVLAVSGLTSFLREVRAREASPSRPGFWPPASSSCRRFRLSSPWGQSKTGSSR